jgi:hypothetical protein
MLTTSVNILLAARMEQNISPTQRQNPNLLQQSHKLLQIIAAALYPDIPDPDLRMAAATKEGYADAITQLLENESAREKILAFWDRERETFSNSPDLMELVMDQLGE